MTVLDASIVIDGLARPRSQAIEDLIRGQVVRIATVSVAEVIDVLMRRHGVEQTDIVDRIDLLRQAGLEIEPLSARQALGAGSLRARRYDKQSAAVSMADCVAIALAAEVGEPIASTDCALLAVAVTEGVPVIELTPFRS